MSDHQFSLRAEIGKHAETILDPAGREVDVLSQSDALMLAEKFNCSLKSLYLEAMDHGVCPVRYVRNHDALSLTDQLVLAKSNVAIIGAGGLGGHVIQLLARIGIGSMIIVDPDKFDETNLNRQTFATLETIGLAKTDVAKKHLKSINPAVEVSVHEVKLNALNSDKILSGADIVVDCLDSISDRLMLQDAAQNNNIPLVHGAVSGFEGQLMTIFPQDPGLKSFYVNPDADEVKESSPESILGVPAITPSVIGSLQVMEVVKVLLKRGRIIRKKIIYFDLDNNTLSEFSFEKKKDQSSVD